MPMVRFKRACRRYLIMMLIIAMLLSVGIGTCLYVLAREGLAPPPALSGSISFDEKALLVHRKPLGPTNVLMLGSSMALRHIDSAYLVDHLPEGTTYLNLASTGMRISHTLRVMRMVLDDTDPQVVMLMCAMVDFTQADRPLDFFDSDEVRRFMEGKDYWLATLRHLNLPYYIKSMRESWERRGSPGHPGSHEFDAWGGAMRDLSYPNVSDAQWNQLHDPSLINPEEYDALDELATILARRGVELIIIQPPYRMANVTPEMKARLDAHWAKVLETVSDRQALCVDMQAILGDQLDDSHFFDYIHMNTKGAKAMTRALLKVPQVQRALGITP